MFKCGGTHSSSDDGDFLPLLIDMRKWFTGSWMWLLSVNEEIEVFGEPPDRFAAELHQIDQVREVQLTIFGKNLN